MPRYRFLWENLPEKLLLTLCRTHLSVYDEANPATSLKQIYGARPKEEFVKEAWPALLEHWVGQATESRKHLVAAVRAQRAEAGALRSKAAQIAYLRELRNAKRLRAAVLDEFIAYGEADQRAAAERGGRRKPPGRTRSGSGSPRRRRNHTSGGRSPSSTPSPPPRRGRPR